MYRLMYFVKHPKQFLLTTVNSMRPTANYLAIAQEAGINLSPLGVKLSGDPAKRSAELAKAAEKALWSKIDVNEQNKLIVYKNSLINKLFTDKNRPKINPAPQGLMNRITYFWKNPSKLTGLLTGGLSAEDQLLQAARKKGWQKNLIRKIDSIEQISKRISSTKIMSVMAAALLMAVVVGVFLQKLVFMFIAPLDKHLVPKTKLKPKTGDDDDDATGFQKRMNSLIQSVPTGRRVNA
jgi:hypothetical protein